MTLHQRHEHSAGTLSNMWPSTVLLHGPLETFGYVKSPLGHLKSLETSTEISIILISTITREQIYIREKSTLETNRT